jgi:2-polyprenyl-6-methoxyphenol hydroxylase-like FAD-dependent oxidoreductase
MATKWDKKGNGETGSMEADFVIGSDGQGSLIRKIVLPGDERTFPGHCALRGTLKERDATPATREASLPYLKYPTNTVC